MMATPSEALQSPAELAIPAETTRETAETTKERFYLPQLDILRFFAFLAVFIGDLLPSNAQFYDRLGVPHAVSAAIVAAVKCGPYGVDLFFVLSSYLITKLLLREIEMFGKVDTFAFYVRRALRIWPLYFFFLFGYFFLQGWIPLARSQKPLTAEQLIPFSLFVANFEIMRQPFLQVVHLWSISIEEQFYIAWALVMRWVKPAALPFLALGAIVVAVATRAYLVQYASAGTHPGALFVSIFCNTAARLDCLAFGVLLATGSLFARGFRRPLLWIGGAVVAVVVIQSVLPREAPALANVVLTYLVVAVACSVIVRAALDLRPSEGARNRVLTYFGKISFGLYVYSPIAAALTRVLRPVTPVGALIIHPGAALLLTIFISVLSFELIERPFLKLKKRFTHVPSRPV